MTIFNSCFDITRGYCLPIFAKWLAPILRPCCDQMRPIVFHLLDPQLVRRQTSDVGYHWPVMAWRKIHFLWQMLIAYRICSVFFSLLKDKNSGLTFIEPNVHNIILYYCVPFLEIQFWHFQQMYYDPIIHLKERKCARSQLVYAWETLGSSKSLLISWGIWIHHNTPNTPWLAPSIHHWIAYQSA